MTPKIHLNIISKNTETGEDVLLEYLSDDKASNLKLLNEDLYLGDSREFGYYINYSKGESASKEWLNELRSIKVNKIKLLKEHFNSTLELMLFRSFFLIYRALALSGTMVYDQECIDRLYDNFYMDFTGQPGVQPNIYFIKKNIIVTSHDEVIELFNNQHLFKLNIKYLHPKKEVSAFFIPFNIPISNIIQNKQVYNIWKTILSDYDLKLRNFISGK